MIETRPRLSDEYRSYMQQWFSYRTSDYDLSAHRGGIQLDLQQIDLPDATVDVVLTPHVLEHVPGTDTALAELFRVIAPGGRMYLQVPLVYGQTAAPTTPESMPTTRRFSGTSAGISPTVFDRRVCHSRAGHRRVRTGAAGRVASPDPRGDGFHIDALLEHVRVGDLIAGADEAQAHLMGFEPCYHFATWECVRT